MAGTKRDFIYTDDYGRQYAVLMDESNAIISAFGFEPYNGEPELLRPPVGLRLRQAILKHESKSFKRRITCASSTSPAFTGEEKEIGLWDYDDNQEALFKVIYTVAEKQFCKPKFPELG